MMNAQRTRSVFVLSLLFELHTTHSFVGSIFGRHATYEETLLSCAMASKVSVTDMLVNRASREFTNGKMNTEREDD
jgi:hypothetical protein